MAIADIDAASEALKDVCNDLEFIDFDPPIEPRDDADAEAWRDYGLSVADKLAEAEKAVMRAVQIIKE